jgi:opacity protein-like surface antigen
MRRATVLSALLLLACVASAQVKFGAGPQLGFSFASAAKPLDKVYGFGFGFGAHGDVWISKYFSARLNFDYHIFPADEDELTKLFEGITDGQGNPVQNFKAEGAGISFIAVTASGIGKLPTSGPLTPYAIVGFGFGSISNSDMTRSGTVGGQPIGDTVPGESDSGFLLNFGAGSEYSVSKVFTLYFEVKYVLLMISEETNPQTGQKTGGNSSHLPFMFGGTYWF